MSQLQSAKQTVRHYFDVLAEPVSDSSVAALDSLLASDYLWRGMYPFDEPAEASRFVVEFWAQLQRSFTSLQRREQVFLAGENAELQEAGHWVCSMGQFIGLFDSPWLDIPATNKLTVIPYAEFHRVDRGRIVETTAFFDILSVMRQAGQRPLPPQTGSEILRLGPLTQDGLLLEAQNSDESKKTQLLVQRMIRELTSSDLHSSKDELHTSWHSDMTWFGPDGIGSTYTLQRYELQHQGPFSGGLTDFEFDGNDCVVAEGNYCGLFCWSGFRMRPTGGFMGLPATNLHAEMRVVDIYRREGDKLAENWVFIDMLYFLKLQGLDVLARLETINRAGSTGI